jgi:hypothetical protein
MISENRIALFRITRYAILFSMSTSCMTPCSALLRCWTKVYGSDSTALIICRFLNICSI